MVKKAIKCPECGGGIYAVMWTANGKTRTTNRKYCVKCDKMWKVELKLE